MSQQQKIGLIKEKLQVLKIRAVAELAGLLLQLQQ